MVYQEKKKKEKKKKEVIWMWWVNENSFFNRHVVGSIKNPAT